MALVEKRSESVEARPIDTVLPPVKRPWLAPDIRCFDVDAVTRAFNGGAGDFNTGS